MSGVGEWSYTLGLYVRADDFFVFNAIIHKHFSMFMSVWVHQTKYYTHNWMDGLECMRRKRLRLFKFIKIIIDFECLFLTMHLHITKTTIETVANSTNFGNVGENSCTFNGNDMIISNFKTLTLQSEMPKMFLLWHS